jgi:hypothetical protein
METTAPVSPARILLLLALGALPALALGFGDASPLQRWDLPITAGVLLGGLLLARRRRAEHVPAFPGAWPLALLLTTVLPLTLHALQKAPTTNDERAYLYQAELFTEGRVSEPVQQNALVDFTLRRRQVHEDRERDMRYGKYPLGTSAWFAPGVAIGWPASMAIVSALLAVAATRRLARAYQLAQPATAAFLLAISPFFLLVQGSFQSEVVTLPLALLAWLALLRARQGGVGWAVAVGLACGAIFLARPLTGVVAAGACALGLATLGPARARLMRLGAATLGGLPCLALALAYHAALTGDPWTSPYEAYAQVFQPSDVFGQGDVLAGLGRQAARWAVGLGMLGGVALGFAGLFQLRARDGGAGFVFALGLPVVYAFHWYPGHWAYLGPLYCYESLGLLLIGFLALLERAPAAWGKNLVLALASWGVIVAVPRLELIHEQGQLRSAPERVAATLEGEAVLLLPYVAVPAMQEHGLKFWTPSRRPADERVAIVRELANPDHTRRALGVLGLAGRPIYRLSPRTSAQEGEADHEALRAIDLED